VKEGPCTKNDQLGEGPAEVQAIHKKERNYLKLIFMFINIQRESVDKALQALVLEAFSV
jgi:hypothetical protein